MVGASGNIKTPLIKYALLATLIIFLFPAFAHALPGDIDGSGRVDGYDLIAFSLAFGSSSGDSNWNPDADMDGSGTVDASDLTILSTHFGDHGISFGLWTGDLTSGDQRVSKLSNKGNLLRRVASFSNPLSISGNLADGSIWVADSGSDKVKKLDPFDGSTLLTVNGMDPYAVSVNSQDGSVWVADYINNRVVKLSPSVTDGYTIGTDTGSHMVINGFSRPRSVSVNPDTGVVWVADTNNNRIVRLSPDITDGYDISADTGKHLVKTGFNSPYYVSVNVTDGAVWVADYNNNEVVKLSATGTTELYRIGGFNQPYSLQVNYMDGSVWIADKRNDRVVRLAADGAILATATGFDDPYSVAVNPLDGTVWVADYYNDQVVKLSASGAELLRVSGFDRPLFVAVTPDGVSASKSPTASTSLSANVVDVAETVTFTGTGSDPDGNIVLYEWDYEGDGTFDYQSATTGVTTHAYGSAGIYNPVFRVTDNEFLTATDATQIVRVGNLKAIAGSDVTTGAAPLTVSFTAAFVDPIDGRIDSYQWDFDGDNTFDYFSDSTGNTTHTYNDAGSYTATLKIVDGARVATDSIAITVSASGPTANASGAPTSGVAPLSVAFSGSGYDPDGSIVLLQWDFDGDGAYDWNSVTTGNTTHIYGTTGTYAAKFRVTDNDGLTDTQEVTVTVGQAPPVAVANASPSEGYPPLTVNFNATGSQDPNGSITLYEWDYGECSIFFSDLMESGASQWTADSPWAQITTDFHSSSTSWTDSPGGDYSNNANTSLTSNTIDLSSVSSASLSFWHRYNTEPGWDYGRVGISTDGGTIWTELANYTGTLNDWTKVELDLSPYLPSANVKIRFRLTSDDSVVRDGWYIDDVAIESCQPQWNVSSDGTASHQYTNVSTFTATLRITDNDGNQATDTVDITVFPLSRPTATAGADVVSGTAPLTVNFTGAGQDPTGSITGYDWNFGEEYVWVADTSNDQMVRLYQDGSGEMLRKSGFNDPRSVSVNRSDGTIWVADTFNDQVVRLAADGRAELVRVGGFDNPYSVSVNPADGTVWVADFLHHQVVKLAPDGTELARVGGFYNPYSVSVNPADGTVWVADYNNSQVVKLDSSGSELARVSGFKNPYSVSVNPTDGTVWVADTYNDQVVKLDSSGSELARVSGFNNPYSVSVNSADGTVWVADSYNNQVVKLSADGGSELARVSGFYRPASVSVNPTTGRVWVADQNNHQVVKLDSSGTELARLSGFYYPGSVSFADTGAGNYYTSTTTGGASHTYSAPGIYRTFFSVTDNDGNTDVDTLDIRVFGIPTVSAASSRSGGSAPLEVFLSATVIDLDGTITKYEWDFDGDGTYDYESADSPNVRHVYSSAGTYTATLRVTDMDGYQGAGSVTITVSQAPPEIIAGAAPVEGNAQLAVTFSGSGTDPDGSIVQYEWDFESDGTFDYSSSTTASTTHTYDTAGTFTATLRATDNDGLQSTDTIVVNVSAAGTPSALLYASPTSGPHPLEVRFCGHGFDPDGTITTYEWDFDGDGTYDSSSSVSPTALGDKMENGAGYWTADSPWGLTSADYFSRAFSWTDSPGGDYADNANTSLTSATIDLSTATAPRLIFWHRYDIKSYDYGRVEVSGNNGSSWTQIETYTNGTLSQWTKQELDLSAYAGNSTVKVRFRFTSNSSNTADGWYIDDVWVGDCPTHTYAAHGVYTPVLRVTDNDGKQDTATENIHVIENRNTSFIWVSDYGNNKVVKLSEGGTELARISGFNRPRGIDVDESDGDVWVADTYNDRVVKLSSGIPDDYNVSISKITQDSTSNNNPGLLYGDAVLGTGNLNGGVSFDGNGDYIEIGDSQVYRMDSWTIEAWVNPSALSGTKIIAGKVSQGKDFALVLSGDKLGVLIYDGGRGYLLDSTAATAGQWYHAAAVYDASAGALRLYVDGVFIAESTAYTPDTSNTDPFRIGSSFCCGEYFQGLIDDVRVWNVARTAAEIADNKDAELTGTEAGLVGYWKLNSTPDTPFHQVVTGFNDPYDVSVNASDGSVWVTDYYNHEVVKLGADGAELARVTGFSYPWALDVDAGNGVVWVTETGSNRVSRFSVNVPNGFMVTAKESTPDSTSNGNTGYFFGDTASSSGNLSGGVALDGSGDYITILSDSALDVQSFTVEAWINGSYVNSRALFMRGNSTGGNELYFGFSNNSTIRAYLDDGAAIDISGSANFVDGNWHHLALVFDSTAGELRAYVDGALYGAPVSVTATLDFGGSNALIGADFDSFNAGLGNYFQGLVDDVRLWSVARSEAEIAAAKDAELTGSEAGLVGYWKLNSTGAALAKLITGFNDPRSVSVDASDGSVWVADYWNDRIVKLASDGSMLRSIGGFNKPTGVAVDQNTGSAWVADYENDQVVKLSSVGAEISRLSGFDNPHDLDVNLGDGTVWVADYWNDRVVKLAPDGTELLRLGGFNDPIHLAVDGASRNLSQPPVASTGVNPASGDAPLTVTFTGSATDNGSIVSYEWDFEGDGTFDYVSATTGNTTHTYTAPGTYNPTFRVTDDEGMMDHDSSNLVYVGRLTVSLTVSPASGDAPLNVTLTGAVTGLAPDNRITRYDWDFEGDGVFDYSDSSSFKTTHRYNTGGAYLPILKVTDSAGNTAYANAALTVNKVPPTANNYSNPASGTVPLTVTLSGIGSDADGSIVLYEWDYDGDGVYDWFSQTIYNTSFTYTTVGTFNLTLRVTDNDGLTATASKQITVNDRTDPPVAIASADTTEGAAPLTVNFTGTGNDPDDGNITLYEWDFDGDGVYDFNSTATGNTSHTYSSTGQFGATLRVTDSDNLTDTETVLITVKAAGIPTAAANANPTVGATPLTVSFNAAGSSDPDGSIVLYEWTFGDEVVWVADYNNNNMVRLQGYQVDKTLAGFNRPYRLSINRTDGSVWVSDKNNNQVVKLKGDGSLELVRVGGFNSPQGLSVVQSDGSVWVADNYNHQVVKLSSTGSELVRVGGFDNPPAVVVDQSDGSVWVVDDDHNEMVKLAADGTELARIGGFNGPVWASIDPNDGSVWVADRYNDRVVKLARNTPDGYHTSVSLVTPDTTSNGNTGVLFGNAGADTGNLNGGIVLDGGGDYIQIPNSAALNVQSFTIEAWIKATWVSNRALFMRGNSAGGNELYFGFYNNSTFEVILDGGSSNLISGSANFHDGNWHHVALVHDAAADEIRTYVDGALYGSPVSIAVDLDFGGSRALIGADFDSFNASLGNYFDGIVDDVRVWNVARTEAEIAAGKDAELTGSETGLVGYWKMNSADNSTFHTALGGFVDPFCVAVNPGDGTAWVCDYYNDEMIKVSADAKQAILRVGGFNGPHEASVNPNDGSVWVADQLNNQVVKLAADGREVTRISGFNQPTSVMAYSSSSSVYSSTTDTTINHIYNRDGEYVATLRVTDNDGNTDSDSVTIKAGTFPESLPTAYPTTGPAPLTVLFASNGNSPSGTIESFIWDFDGDGTSNWTTPTSENYSFTYNAPGTYLATLTVVDNRGLTDTKSITIIVTQPDIKPTAQAIADPIEGNSPLQVSLTGLGKDFDGFITKFEWDYENDGTFDYTSTTTGATSHTYSSEGVHTPLLRVTDNDGNTGTDTARIEVKPVGAPTASAAATPTSGSAALDVQFTGSGTDNGSIVKYEWDFDGDGTYEYSSTTTGATTHSYTAAGDYSAVLRVTDNDGLTDTDVVNISVSLGISATLSADAFDPTNGETVKINSTITSNVDKFTLRIKDRVGNVVRTVVSNAQRAAGYYSDTWDGKDDNAQLVDSGVYLYVIEYEIGGRSFVYDITSNVNSNRYAPPVTYPDNFNPFSSETNFFRYTLDSKSEVTIYISFFGGTYGLSGPRVKTLLLREPRKKGSYVQVWDGTNDMGEVVQPHTYVIAVFGWRLPDNAIIVNKEPIVSDLLVTPTFLNPDARPYDETYQSTFTYSLSKTADVSVKIFDQENFLVKTINVSNVPAGGGNTITWDGKNDSGLFVAPGTYRFKLTATDANGAISKDANALIEIFY